MKIGRKNGDKGVRITDGRYGVDCVEVSVMRNGFQWTGFEADKELLEMLRDAIDEYLTHNE